MCGRYRLSRRKQIVEEHFDSILGDRGSLLRTFTRHRTRLSEPHIRITRTLPLEQLLPSDLRCWGRFRGQKRIPCFDTDASNSRIVEQQEDLCLVCGCCKFGWRR
jgi:hypothetical protein